MHKILICLFSIFCFSKVALAGTSDDMVNSTINNLMQKYSIPGAAVIVYQDGKIKQYLFGVMNNKTHAPVVQSTIFELGSITKTFSGLLLAQKILAGEINLNDHLVDYLDNSETASNSIKQITLLELATHTSSLPYNEPDMTYNAAANSQNSKLLNKFLHLWKAPYPTGTATLYSNFAFAMLGMAIASYEKTSLALLMKKEILQPLGMSSSFLTIPADKMKYYAQGYTAKSSPSRSPNGGLLAGSWAMKSSVNDMGQYLKLALCLDNMPADMVAAMKIAQSGYFEYTDKSQIGMGWMIQPLDKISSQELLKVVPMKPRKKTETPVNRIGSPQYITNALIEKTGATNGFRAYIGVIPEQKLGVVILVNRFIYDSNAVKHAGRDLLLNR